MTAHLKFHPGCIFLTLMVLLFNCKAADSQSKDKTLQTELKSKLGSDVVVENSVNGTFALYKQAPGGHAARVYKYAVVRVADKSIVSEGTFKMGYVKWEDDTTLELVTNESNDRSAEPTKKFINLTNNSN
jgi:hypothetical protein